LAEQFSRAGPTAQHAKHKVKAARVRRSDISTNRFDPTLPRFGAEVLVVKDFDCLPSARGHLAGGQLWFTEQANYSGPGQHG
jgi:hypothetical protein